MNIRLSKEKDLEAILEIYAHARKIMRENGNPNQWGDSYPEKEVIEEDIRCKRSYLCEEEGRPVGTFAFFFGGEPDYAVIENGMWLSDAPYGTIHRVATNGQAKGVARACFDYCKAQTGHLRIDTHQDNKIMQKVLANNGFKHCGTIYVRDGSPRLAYEYLKQYIHISFDDVYACLKDIIDKADAYVSVFENVFFGWLKEMHDTCGAVFTLYTFNYDNHAPEYDISDLPAKYAKELAESASWLKFAFHAKDNLKKYDEDNETGICADYEKFTSAILRATGGCVECIDRVNRLGFFAGSKANVEALQQCEYGLLGLLTADNSEERISYYFDGEQTKQLNQAGEFADAENGLLFLRSQLRLENVEDVAEQFKRIQSYHTPKVIEIFTHEQCFYQQSKIEGNTVEKLLEKYIKWAVKQGYGFGYAMELYGLQD